MSDNNGEHNIRNSIPLLIFKDLAKHYRQRFGRQYDIKAHPVHDHAAILVFKSKTIKITFHLSAGDINLLLAILKLLSVPQIKSWVNKYDILHNPTNKISNTSQYILSVDILFGSRSSKTKIPTPIGIDLINPDSISDICHWIIGIIANVQPH